MYHSSSEVARVSCRFQLKFENHGKTKYTQIIIRTLSQVKWQSHKYHIYIQIGTAFGTGKRKTENQFGGILCECARFNNKNTTRKKPEPLNIWMECVNWKERKNLHLQLETETNNNLFEKFIVLQKEQTALCTIVDCNTFNLRLTIHGIGVFSIRS